MEDHERRVLLEAYAQGRKETRDVLMSLDLDDYADLVIELGKYQLSLPKPDYPARERHLQKATEILQPLLRQT